MIDDHLAAFLAIIFGSIQVICMCADPASMHTKEESGVVVFIGTLFIGYGIGHFFTFFGH